MAIILQTWGRKYVHKGYLRGVFALFYIKKRGQVVYDLAAFSFLLSFYYIGPVS